MKTVPLETPARTTPEGKKERYSDDGSFSGVNRHWDRPAAEISASPTQGKTVEKLTLKRVAESSRRLCSGELEKALTKQFGLKRRQAGSIIRRLVKSGELVYTYELGCSFVEISFQKPVRITDRLVLVPAGMSYPGRPAEVTVYLKSGAAFGSGQHPTTRLALRGIAFALGSGGPLNLTGRRAGAAVLDVGTGSGVLVVAAAKLGIDRGIGLDIDPCAGAEARENVRLNDLGERIRIAVQSLDEQDVGRGFVMITANLRLPSLVQMCRRFAELVADDGCIVLSGIRADEIQRLIDAYDRQGFRPCWQATENGWAGVVFTK